MEEEAVQDSKDFRSQSKQTQHMRGEESVELLTAIKKGYRVMGDEIIEFSTEFFFPRKLIR